MSLSSVSPEYFCPSNENINLTGKQNNIQKTLTAKNEIITNEVIENGSDIKYIAGSSIKLKKGFSTNNSHFRAYYKPTNCCDEFYMDNPFFKPPQSSNLKNYTKNINMRDHKEIKENNEEDYEINFDNEVLIYPNPSKGIINIELKNNENTLISIMNMQGKIIYSNKINNINSTINLSGNTKGLYLIKIICPDYIIHKKFLLQ